MDESVICLKDRGSLVDRYANHPPLLLSHPLLADHYYNIPTYPIMHIVQSYYLNNLNERGGRVIAYPDAEPASGAAGCEFKPW